jgi:hypothetical protein
MYNGGAAGVGVKMRLRHPACLLLASVVLSVAAPWLAAADTIVHGAGNLEPALTPQAYLPAISRFICAGDVLANGNLEQGAVGWHQYTTGENWKDHELIGTAAEGYNPYDGVYGARLGGYEGVWDVLTQTVTIPAGGQLSYWWQMGTTETEIFPDDFGVDLLTLDGEQIARLAGHGIQGPEGIWQQDVVDVSTYAGQTLVLRLHAYNDNYYPSWFDLDLVCLCPAWRG